MYYPIATILQNINKWTFTCAYFLTLNFGRAIYLYLLLHAHSPPSTYTRAHSIPSTYTRPIPRAHRHTSICAHSIHNQLYARTIYPYICTSDPTWTYGGLLFHLTLHLYSAEKTAFYFPFYVHLFHFKKPP